MCGEKTGRAIKVRIEGAIMAVCEKCAKLGTPIDPPKKETPAYVISKPQVQSYVPSRNPAPARPIHNKPVHIRKREPNLEDVEISPDYAEIIKEAREKMSWSQDDLAAKLMEKKNVLSSIERGALRPSIKIARKLEKLLGIKLVEAV